MTRCRIVLSNNGSTDSVCYGTRTKSNRIYTFCGCAITDSYRMGTRCRGADARSQSIIAGSTLIFVVGIRIWFDRFYTVIMDAAAAGSASATAVIDQIDHLFQLGHVDSICIILAGCHIGDLTGLLCSLSSCRIIPVRCTAYGNRSKSRIPDWVFCGTIGIAVSNSFC